MRLISATVRNYRVHREVVVDFDQARTLIGGPNESGKSTLIEAIHRALFLKATVTGEAQQRMESTIHQGRPEVEVRFTAGGAEYQLAKRFSGPSGTTRLTQMGGQTWQGEEAESRLAALLGVESTGGGKGVLGRVSEQWAHLWVWQGESGKDPAKHVASQQASLLQQLQQVGGAAAMQSELDGRVAAWFSESRGQVFAKSGVPLKGSELFQAQAEAKQAETTLAEAKERQGRLRHAVEDFEEASSVIERTAVDLEAIAGQRQSVNEKLSEVEKLRRTEETQAVAHAGLTDKLAVLVGIEANIAELRESADGLSKSLEPLEERRAQLEARLNDLRRSKGEAEQAYDQALEATRGARLKAELAGAYATRFKREARSLELHTRLKRVQDLQDELAAIRGRIAQLASIDQAGLEALQGLDNRLARASAAVEAMATEVEVVASDQAVQVGTTRLAAGESHTVSDLTEVTVGAGVRLRIHPGGGDSLAEARDEVRSARGELQRSLDKHGLESIAQAAEMVARRADLRSQQGSTEAALREWDAEDLAELCKIAEAELAAATAEVQRRGEQMAGAEQPSTLAEAEAWFERERELLQTAESSEAGFKVALDVLREQLAAHEREFNESRDLIEGERQRLTGVTAQLELLILNHGSDEMRAQLLDETRQAKAKLEVELGGVRQALGVLQPELLEADRERLRRAWEEADQRRQTAETSRAVAQATLRSDGTDDPHVVLAQAEARLEAATERLRTVSRKAVAIALVDDLFQQEQRALSDQFSRPLAQGISAYLQCLFGPEAEAVVRFEDNAFMGVGLARSAQAGAMAFDSLSEGAREQVAAAVRLATAELLAADHDGSLPVVFDDAFAYSDPERVATLQRMLEHGASRGLQIIVLTCNPSDYATLGAHQVTLK